jgi:hypothetical protein
MFYGTLKIKKIDLWLWKWKGEDELTRYNVKQWRKMFKPNK